MRYLVADNASLNPLTATKLREKYGWIVEYVRCLPHCLNLVMVALLEPFDAAFGISVSATPYPPPPQRRPNLTLLHL